jgi:hypothetical protein
VKAGYAAAAIDPNHASLGRMFNVPEYDAMYKGKLADLQAKFGDAYEKKYGRPLDRIYFGSVDTGSAIKGSARADIAVDKGTAKDMAHLNSPDGRKTFTMRFLSQDGKAMTIDSRGESYTPEAVVAPQRRRRA